VANKYNYGDVVRVRGTFTDEDEVVHDPTVVSVTVLDPANSETTYVYGTNDEVVKLSVGIYYIEVSATEQAGEWHLRWFSTGTGKASQPSSFLIGTRLGT